jgi:hypothetical protein
MSTTSQTAYVVVGAYQDGSGSSEDVYGPYTQDRAVQIAEALHAGNWQSMTWEAKPLRPTPWETATIQQRQPNIFDLFTDTRASLDLTARNNGTAQ